MKFNNLRGRIFDNLTSLTDKISVGNRVSTQDRNANIAELKLCKTIIVMVLKLK